MIVDTSVVIAIAKAEPEAARFIEILSDPSQPRKMSAGSLIEAQAVLLRSGFVNALNRVEALVLTADIEIVPVDWAQARIAGFAYQHYGRGCGDPPALNFGDCFAYALARATGEPLLFKGNDFPKTDVIAVLR